MDFANRLWQQRLREIFPDLAGFLAQENRGFHENGRFGILIAGGHSTRLDRRLNAV